MAPFGGRKPLHRALAEAGGVDLDGGRARPEPAQAAEPPGWDGEQRGEPGIHGVPRARRWDAVATASDVPDAAGDRIEFVALDDGTLVVDEDEPDAAVGALADAVALAPPYRAEAVRRHGRTWAVAVSRIQVARLPGLDGDSAELVSTREGRTLTVDGRRAFGSALSLERVGEAVGREYVVRAQRVDGDLWQVEATPL
ncbi:MAG TPA: hypothetical protein VFA05_06710 [Gaiellaceae bacterium]|nr:hypothetical protein [Gaiellaceae bacterium]